MEAEIKKLREEIAEQRATVDRLRTEIVEQKNSFRLMLKIAAGIAAFATVGLLAWQNVFVYTQYQQSRRTDLITFLYETKETEDGAVPKADQRTRAEAVKEFVLLERKKEQDSRIDLSRALLNKVVLPSEDLTFISFYKADFSGADLRYVNFTDSYLRRVKLNGAKLKEVNLSGADIECADFRGVENFTCPQLHTAKYWSLALRDKECGQPIPEEKDCEPGHSHSLPAKK